jgi:hypothetical protein
MPTATVNGTSLNYDALGAGPACLVMHGGLGIDHTFFRPLLDRLASRVRMLARTIYSAGAWRRSMEILAGWSSVDRLGELRVPALVIAGRHDVLSSPQQAYRIGHRLGGAEVVVFEHSGHTVMYDEPERFFSVEDWLDRRATEVADV